jgi:hypothetical protein
MVALGSARILLAPSGIFPDGVPVSLVGRDSVEPVDHSLLSGSAERRPTEDC